MSLPAVNNSESSLRTNQILSADQLVKKLEHLADDKLLVRIKNHWDSFASEIQSGKKLIQSELCFTEAPLSGASFMRWAVGATPRLRTDLEGDQRVALYKKKSCPDSFTFQAVNIDGQMRLLMHTGISLGKGCFKKGKAVVDMYTGKIFAQLITQKPHKVQTDKGTRLLDGSKRIERQAALSADTRIEGETYRILSHPHILKALFHGHITTKNADGSVANLAMKRREIIAEYCMGSFKSVLNSGQLTVNKAIHIAGHYANALAHMHEQNLFHFDLKSDNVLVTEEHQGKIADFGCSVHFPEVPANEFDTDRLDTVLLDRRQIHERDRFFIIRTCHQYQESKNPVLFQSITTFLGKIDVWMFSGVLVDIFNTFSSQILDSSELKNLIEDMHNPRMESRPTMKEVQTRLASIKLVPAVEIKPAKEKAPTKPVAENTSWHSFCAFYKK